MATNQDQIETQVNDNTWVAPKLEVIDKNIIQAGGPGTTDAGILS